MSASSLPENWRAEVALAYLDEGAELLKRSVLILGADVAARSGVHDLAWEPQGVGSLRAARAATEYAAKLTWCARREILATLRAVPAGVRP